MEKIARYYGSSGKGLLVGGLGGYDNKHLGETAFLAGLAKLAGFCGCLGVIATITSASGITHHPWVHTLLHVLLHGTGFIEDMRARDALKSNRETKQKDSECTHATILEERG